ncbi:hypothetical protein [Cupriavidus plantarum]|uniref:Uncharacterized protein n=1 Tax=Cupriavidus plantarum TaxID=942865 RepID=A0A316EMW4_9BURK|nr:hypothetical protein [Cupriavidus plantarum]PWK33469.1 hypothetical protein C7419_104144 [Cupriavidus plantarum]
MQAANVLIKWMTEGAIALGFSKANYVGAVAEAAFGQLMQKRIEAARDILQEEISRATSGLCERRRRTGQLLSTATHAQHWKVRHG